MASATFTDEAALLEACRIPVHAIPGDPTNLKVTLPDDLRRVELALAAGARRIGFGHDSHPFGPGAPLRLGGVTSTASPPSPGTPTVTWRCTRSPMRCSVRPASVTSAASSRPTPRRRAASRATDCCATVVDGSPNAASRPATVDLVIIGARPRLGTRLDAMRAAIAATLGVDEGRST